MNPGQVGKEAAAQASKDAAKSAAKEAAKSSAMDAAKTGFDAKGTFVDGVNAVKDYNEETGNAVAADGFKEGDKVAPGKVVNDEGEIVDSATKEGMMAAANIASAIFTGGTGNAAIQAGKTAGTQAAKEGAKQAAKEGAKQAAKEGAKQAAKEGAKNAAKEGTKQAAKEGAKQGAKGFGAGNKNMLGSMPGGMGGGNNNGLPKEAINKLGGALDRGIGMAADELEKLPGVEQSMEEGKEVFQAINGAFDVAGAATSGDVEGVKQGVKKIKKAGYDLKVKWIARIGIVVFFLLIIVSILILPFEGGYLTLNDFMEDAKEVVGNAWSALTGSQAPSNELVKSIIGEVDDFDNLSQNRKNILLAAALAVGKPYSGSGRPTNTSLDGLSSGVDSGGLMEWLIWNISGADPGYLNGNAIAASDSFTSISEGDLKPGDFGVNGDVVGIYFGGGEWVIVDTELGVVRTSYSGFTTFYRYSSIDSSTVINSTPTTIDEKVQAVLQAAQLAVDNKIPYEMGGIVYQPGIDGNHFGEYLFTSSYANTGYTDYNEKHNHFYKGLDCSNFVGWALYTGIGDRSCISQGCKGIKANAAVPINASELRPGDIGFYIDYSHVGLYAGDGYWYEQGSGGDYKEATVNGETKMSKGYTKYTKDSGFVIYYRLKALM